MTTPPEPPSTPRGDECREAFETWHDALFDISARSYRGVYGYPQVSSIQSRWQAWQACWNLTHPAQAALSEVEAVPIIALTLYERDPATSNGLALSWRQCEDIFPERINQVLGDAEAAYRALTSQNRR